MLTVAIVTTDHLFQQSEQKFFLFTVKALLRAESIMIGNFIRLLGKNEENALGNPLMI